jgi:chlorophyll/bacteriochlorophyll a synthase
MWAFACGAVSSGAAIGEHWLALLVGVVLAGPLVCATSQAVNDWFDRHVDAINEPARPIPSGRMPGQWGLYLALIWTAVSLLVSFALGPWGVVATILGLLLAWAYSAPPLRLKLNGWWGNAACGFSYEGLAWFTGCAVMLGGQLPATQSIVVAVLYSLGAHGIMTLNDFKSVEGDLRTGVRSLPVQLGVRRSALVACWSMALPQVCVTALLLQWGKPWHGAVLLVLLALQIVCMRRWLTQPRELAPWYNGTGVLLYVSGMMVSAWALRGLA